MATDLTSVAIKDGFSQLLHCDGGLASTETAVLDGDGTSSTLSLGTGSATIAGNLVISGNLTVSGTTTEINTQTLNVADNIVVLNNDVTGTPSQNAGIEVERGTSTNTLLRWNESSDRWQFTNDGSTYYNIPISTEYNNYTLPTASSSTLGGIKVGTNLSIDGNGVLSASGSFTSFTIADTDSTQAIGDSVHIKFAASNSGSYGNSQISGSGTSGSPYLITLYAPDTDTNTTDLNTLSAGTINTANDSIGFIDADDSNASKKESIADFLTAIAGSGISASSGQLSRDSIALSGLSNVSSVTPSTGQYLVYGGSQWEPTSVTAMTSWYLRDGDTTAVQVTDGKYVKFVEGNNLIDINFTDTDSGAVDDEFDVTFTVNSSNITSIGTLTGLTTSGDISISTSSDPALTFTSAESSTDNWKIYIAGSGLKFRNTTDSNTAFELTHANNGGFTGTVTWSGGSSTNANTAYGWGDHASAGYLENLTGTSIKTLLDVASNSPSNGQILQWNSTANYYEPVTFTSSYSWYLRDGDTTAVEITSGKYVKLVEGTGIDINFTDTSSGAVDDEYDVTITNTLMTSGGTISGAVTFDASPVFSTAATGTLANRDGFTDFIGYNSSYGSYIGGGASNASRYIYAGGYFYDGSSVRTLIHSGNIGSQSVASATNADTVDSLHASSFVRTDATSVIKSGNALHFSPDADSFLKVNMDARTSGDGARIHRWNRNNADSAYLAYYENWYDGNSYGSFGHDGNKWVFNQQIKVADAYGNAYFGGNQSDEWGRIQFESFSNGVYLYTDNGGFKFDSPVYPYGDGTEAFGSPSLRWNLLYGNQYYAWDWFRAKGTSGLYFQDYGGGWRMTDSTWIRSYGSKYVYIDSLLSASTLNVATSGGITPAQHDNTPVVGSKTNIVARFNGSIHLDSNNDSISFGSGTATFMHDEEIGFGWGGGWYMVDTTYLRVRNNKHIYTTGDTFSTKFRLQNAFIWSAGSSDYANFSSWLQSNGSHGIYWPSASGASSSPHLYWTNNSYGSLQVHGGNGSYPGWKIGTHSNKPTLMFNESSSSGGIYYQGTGRWAVFHNYSHNCLGVDTSSTESAYELKVNGDILATGDVVAFSDARWKTEIETISNPIDKIMDMRGVYYKELPKGDKKVSDRRKMGVIAQEILKVAPEVVTYGETNDEYAVDYSKLVGILIEGIKELKQEINELKGN